jgi:hypothetical protein
MNLPEDPFVQELLPEFVDSWIEDFDTIFPPIIGSKNSDELYRFAHTIKGSCFQFGFDEIGEMGILMMGFAKEKDWEKAIKMAETIKNSLIDIKSQMIELGFIFEQK